jgi:hypothetical protein
MEVIERVRPSRPHAISLSGGELLISRTSRRYSKQMDHLRNLQLPPNQLHQDQNKLLQHANRGNQNNLNIHIIFSQKSTGRWNV